MKKADMITSIQKEEATLWLAAKRMELLFGRYEAITMRYFSSWSAIHQLMEVLGIKSNSQLPENKEASEIVYQIYQQQQNNDVVKLEE
jgi:hypothetical protein